MQVHKHCDADYHHSTNEINFWLPLTCALCCPKACCRALRSRMLLCAAVLLPQKRTGTSPVNAAVRETIERQVHLQSD